VLVIHCHAPPKARAHLAALLGGTAYRLASAVSNDAPGDPAPILFTAYQPSARERRPDAGIRQLAQWRRDGKQAPALVCAFRSKQRLLRAPASAILRAPCTAFLRFPCRRDALLGALEDAGPLSASERDEVVQRACTAWGQFASYADRLIDEEQGADLALLQDFARRHFGDWLDAPLAQAARCRAQGDAGEMTRALREAKQRAPEAAVYRTFGQLAHGRENDLTNRGLGPLRAVVRAMQQGHLGEEQLHDFLDGASWKSFKAALLRTVRTLTLLENDSASLPAALRDEVRAFREKSNDLMRCTSTSAVLRNPGVTEDRVDQMQDAARAVLRRRDEARQRMA